MKTKRIITLLLAVVMTVAMIPVVTATAEEVDSDIIWSETFSDASKVTYASGSGMLIKEANASYSTVKNGKLYLTPPSSQFFVDWQAAKMPNGTTITGDATLHFVYRPGIANMSVDNLIDFRFYDVNGSKVSTSLIVKLASGKLSFNGYTSEALSGGFDSIDVQFDANDAGIYTTATLYLNGKLVGSQNLTANNGNRIWLARFCLTYKNTLTSAIDEITWYKGFYKSEEVTYLYGEDWSELTALNATNTKDQRITSGGLIVLNPSANDASVTDGVAYFPTETDDRFIDLQFGDTPVASIKQTITFSAKVKRGSNNGTSQLVNFGIVSGTQIQGAVKLVGGKLCIAKTADAITLANTPADGTYTYASKAMATDEFTAIELVLHYDGTKYDTLTAYQDGELVGSVDISSKNLTYVNQFRLFRYMQKDLYIKDLTVVAGSRLAFAETKLVGYQCSKVEKGVYSVRVLAEISADDIANVTEAGFSINVSAGTQTANVKKQVTCAYDSVLANGEGGQVAVNASEGTKLIALIITDIPEGTFPTFTISSYFVNGGLYEGNSATFTVQAGDLN